MARKEFCFDFNEDAEPAEELHRLRTAAAKHFKTMEAALEYLRSTPTAKEFLAQPDAGARKRMPRAASPQKGKSANTPAKRRETAKHLMHA